MISYGQMWTICWNKTVSVTFVSELICQTDEDIVASKLLFHLYLFNERSP